MLLRRHALRHAHVMRVGDPVEALQRADLRFLRHDAEDARVDVPAGRRHGHVARAFAELLHDRAGAGRVIFDVLAELLEIGPGLVPALRRILRILVAENVGQAHDEGAAGAGIRRARIDEPVRIGLGPGEQFLGRRRRRLRRGRACIRAADRTDNRSRRRPAPWRAPASWRRPADRCRRASARLPRRCRAGRPRASGRCRRTARRCRSARDRCRRGRHPAAP